MQNEKERFYSHSYFLKNGLQITLRQNEADDVRISWYFFNPFMYSSPNPSLEYTLLSVLVDQFESKIEEKAPGSFLQSPQIFISYDCSIITYRVKSEEVARSLQIFSSLIKSPQINPRMLDKTYTDIEDTTLARNSSIYSLIETIIPGSPYALYNGKAYSIDPALSSRELNEYAARAFFGKRIAVAINGDITERTLARKDLAAFEHIANGNEPVTYPEIRKSLLETSPILVPAGDTGRSEITALFQAPAFERGREYFAYRILLFIIEDIMRQNTPHSTTFTIKSEMINSVNISSLSMECPPEQTDTTLLSFKRCMEKISRGTGMYYYPGDTSNDTIRDYRKQNENSIVRIEIGDILDSYKKRLVTEYSFSQLGNFEMERRFILISHLYSKDPDVRNIKEEIDAISAEDIKAAIRLWFKPMTWMVRGKSDRLARLSEDFFY